MATKKIDISELTTKSKKYMTAAILEKRDKVNTIAKTSAKSALSSWKSVAPHKTGALRNQATYFANKSTAGVSMTSNRFKLVNILNYEKTRQRKTAGFYTRWKNQHGKSFFGKIKGL